MSFLHHSGTRPFAGCVHLGKHLLHSLALHKAHFILLWQDAIRSVASNSVARPVVSPSDISMDSGRLACLGVPLTPLRAALKAMRRDLLPGPVVED